MWSEPIEVPYYSLSPTSLSLFTMIEGGRISERQKESWKNLEDNKNKYGELSSHSTKRLRRAINYMIYTTKEKSITGKTIIAKNQNFTTEYEKSTTHRQPVSYKLAMITLTLPSKQQHTDEVIKSKLLNPFLIELSKKFEVRDYIWKAEKQENGNIHFHILINKYIHHDKIKSIWNRKTETLGYVENYRRNMHAYYVDGFRLSENKADRRSEETQRKAYETGVKENWSNPNSTDIHALYKVRNASAYLVKYLTKGVTKTERIKQINTLRNEIEKDKKTIADNEKEIFFHGPENPQSKYFAAEINQARNRIEENETKLYELLKSGVSGRIWGQSQSLSKLKNLIECEEPENIPQIFEVISSADKVLENKIGTRSINTYIFDVTKFDQLNQKLKYHIYSFEAETPPIEPHHTADSSPRQLFCNS